MSSRQGDRYDTPPDDDPAEKMDRFVATFILEARVSHVAPIMLPNRRGRRLDEKPQSWSVSSGHDGIVDRPAPRPVRRRPALPPHHHRPIVVTTTTLIRAVARVAHFDPPFRSRTLHPARCRWNRRAFRPRVRTAENGNPFTSPATTLAIALCAAAPPAGCRHTAADRIRSRGTSTTEVRVAPGGRHSST
jgi:hypothetical protein